MTPQTVPKRPFGFFVEEMEGENLLYRLGGHKAIHLNDTATLIWKLCDGSRTVQAIIEVLEKGYPGSEAVIAADVLEAVQLLISEGALLDSTAENPTGDNPDAGTGEPR
jgi:pyrroloquinoline quinone biosynthesis protein D